MTIAAVMSVGRIVLGGAAIWLGADLVMAGLSGWFRLQRYFPDCDEPSLLTLHGEPGWVGGLQFRGGGLGLFACRTGLRVRQSPLFAPLERPIFVPWNQIHAQRVAGVFGARAQLSFGNDAGSMIISASSWETLVAVAKDRPPYNEAANGSEPETEKPR